jgi:toxin ParE1/3/4
MTAYVLTPRARADLKSIWTYSVDRWNAEQADRYVGVIHRAMAIVAADPQRGRSYDHVRAGYFMYSAGSHIIFFKRRSDGIVVIRILHQSMDYQRHL